MKRILLVGLLSGVGVVQGSFNPLLLKGTTEALIQAADALKKSEPVAQGKAAKTKKQVVPQGAAVAQRSLTDVEKKLYEDCAPFWGLMYLEKGIAEQWYRLSPKYMYQDFSKAQIEFLVSRKIDIENNSLEKLLGQMYHIGGGQFAVTNATDNIAKYLKPKNIGDILRIINQSLSQALFDKKNLQQQLLDYFKVSLKSELSERGYTKFQPAYLNRFLVPLVDCIAECQQPNSRYPKSTPQHLLISYMLAKSENRNDLQEYMRGLLDNDQFVLSGENYTEKEIEKILSKSPDVKDVQSFADYVCSAVYKQNYHNAIMPKLATHRSVVYKDNVFQDCVESMILNLANIATYGHDDSDDAENSIGKDLLDRQKPKLKLFYSNKKHVENVAVDTQEVHYGWFGLLENKEGLIYSSLADAEHKDYSSITPLRNYVPVPDSEVQDLEPSQIVLDDKVYKVYLKKVGDEEYMLVPKSSGLICYELKGSASNVVMAMSDLFNLGFDMSIQDIFDLNKVAQNFKKMCDVFGWRIDQYVLSNIAEQEYPLLINVEIDKYMVKDMFTIKLLNLHGDIAYSKHDHFDSAIVTQQLLDVDQDVLVTCVGCDLINYFELTEQQKLAAEKFVALQAGNTRVQCIKSMLLQPYDIIDYGYIAKIMLYPIQRDDVISCMQILDINNPKMTELIKLMIQRLCVTDQFLHIVSFVSDNMIERFPRFPAYNAARRLMFGSALPKMFSIIKEENLLSVDQINNMLNIISNALCVDNDDHKKECFDFLSIVYTQNVIDKAQIDTFFIRVNDFLISNLTISRIETLYLIIEENKFSSDQTGKLIQSMRQKMKDFGRNDVEQCIKLVSLMVNKELITIEEMNSLEPVIFAEFKLQFKQLQARLEAKVNAHVVEKQAEMKKNQTDNDLGSELNESARMRDERESKAVYDVMLSRKVDRTIEHSVEV